MKTKILLSALSLSLVNIGFSQSTIELLGAPGAGGPVGNGPSVANQATTLFINSTTPHSPVITATYSLSGQQFNSIEGNPATPGLVFGNNAPTNNDPNLVPAAGNGSPLYPTMNYAGNPQNGYFTACNACAVGTGISIGANRAIELQGFADALIDVYENNLQPLTARVRFADLTISFNRPVTNPVLHLSGMGADTWYEDASVGKFYNHGYATELDLLTPGLTLKRLSGSSKFDVIGNTIKDTAANLGNNAQGATLNGVVRYGAAGSVVVLGSNITTLSFRIYLRGDAGIVTNSSGEPTTPDAGYKVTWARAKGGVIPEGSITGDVFTIGLSLQDPIDISGNVFNDPDGGNVNNSTGTTNSVPVGMYINLVDANNIVVASVPVATDGTYVLPAVFEGSYTAVLSTSNLPAGSTATESTLPAGWQSTGEYTGAPNTGNDGTINGTSIPIVIGSNNVNIANVNFGIKPAVLPIVFGPVTATLKNDRLDILWSTLKETNNSRFEIQASADGVRFVALGSVNTSAVNGNSDAEIKYSFQTTPPAIAAFAIAGLLLFAPVWGKRKWVGLAILMCMLVFVNIGCQKSGKDVLNSKGDKLFIRIAQIDIDGTKSFSKTISINKTN